MGVDQNYGPLFGPLDCKEYTIIETPKGPVILINPHMLKIYVNLGAKVLTRITILGAPQYKYCILGPYIKP